VVRQLGRSIATPSVLADLAQRHAQTAPARDVALWTDDYANVLSIAR
jgi:hypothetical protein